MRVRSFLAVGASLLAASAAQSTVTVISQSALVASTEYYTDNLGSGVLGPNDDGSTGQINLGFDVTFFGQTYSSLWINNNGNVTFDGPLSSFVPSGPTGSNQPIISVYFGDVDTNGAGSGLVHYDLDTANQQLVVTWDNVGYFYQHADATNSFQLVLRGDGYALPNGEGAIGFFYKNMDWIHTDTSTLAAAGFGNGLGDAEVIEGSSEQVDFNDVLENHHLWFDANLDVVPPPAVPEPATWAMMIGGFAFAGAAMRRRNKLAVRYA